MTQVFLGQINFFGANHAHHHHGSDATTTPISQANPENTINVGLNVSSKLSELQGLHGNDLKVHLVPTDGPARDGEIYLQNATFEVVNN